MKKTLILLSNNFESAPFLHSQLIDIYDDTECYHNKYIYCGGSNQKSIKNLVIKNNFATSSVILRYTNYFFSLIKLIFQNKKNDITFRVRDFVSPFLFCLISKFFIKKGCFIYDPRGAFLIEQ